MARIRKIEIENFRCIQSLAWQPSGGLNCLIGPGDSGKSTVLEAIDLCLGARRTVQFSDADFHGLDVAKPLSITIAIGELDDSLRSIESYGLFLRGFDEATGVVEDEPEKELEPVLSLRLTVESDLEPVWMLVSDRAAAQEVVRNLAWADRVRLAPTLIGSVPHFNLSWRRGSVLNRLTDEKPDASAALAKAARDARGAFGDDAEAQLGETLGVVSTTAQELGIGVGDRVRAMLDAHSVTFSGGTISLHDGGGVPLRGLGVGSARLLVAGLQRKAAGHASMLLVDELEHGLEPHRVIRLLGSLGAKEAVPPLQVFMTTHSPVALRELSGQQLVILREGGGRHSAVPVGSEDDVQRAIRLYPDAFLAASVIVCEGASEVGFVRGLDQARAALGQPSVAARGVALVDCGGGGPDSAYARASAFQRLGYRVAVLRDADVAPTEGVEAAFVAAGGTPFAWRPGTTLEDELFGSLTDNGVEALLAFAIDLHGEELIDAHLRSATENAIELEALRVQLLLDNLPASHRAALGKDSRTRKAGWFKSVSWMEEAAREIVAPDLAGCDAEFRGIVERVFGWACDAG